MHTLFLFTFFVRFLPFLSARPHDLPVKASRNEIAGAHFFGQTVAQKAKAEMKSIQ